MKRLLFFCLLMAAIFRFFGLKPREGTIGQQAQTRVPVTSLNEIPSLAKEYPVADPAPFLSVEQEAAPTSASISLEALPSNEQQSLWQAFAHARREVHPIPKSWAGRPENMGYELYAIHPRQKLRTRFGQEGVQLTSSSRTHTEADRGQTHTAWEARMHLTSFAGQPVSLAAAPVKSIEQTTRVEYQHTAILSEWYINQKEGIEHGYTVTSRPAHLREGDAIELQISLSGLKAEKSEGQSEELVFTNGADEILTYSKLKVFDANGQELEARMDATEDGFLLAYQDTDATYPITVDPLISSQEAQLTANDAAAGDRFGESVSISGGTVVVGAPFDDDGGSASGSAYVFTRSGTVWNLQQKLTATDPGSSDQFGKSVSISGDTVVVGARFNDEGGANSGSAYVFARNGAVWNEPQKLTANDPAAGDIFGEAVSVFDDTMVIGASGNDDGGDDSGSAYVFIRSGSLWSFRQKLIANDAAADDRFGRSVSASDQVVVVGASGNDEGGIDSGSAYLFIPSVLDSRVWIQQQKLAARDADGGDQFGISVAISGDTLIVGASEDDDNGSNSGSAYIFNLDGILWRQQQKLIAGDGAAKDYFGISVTLSGDTIVVGAFGDDVSAVDSGSAYVFTYNGTEWRSSQKLTANGAAGDDRFGTSVSISGDTIVVGTPLDNSSGSAHVFTRNGTVWSQSSTLTANDAAAGDSFGTSVSVSGETVVVGALFDDDGGSNSGSSYIFTRTGGLWNLQQKLIADDAMPDDHFGKSVSISGDTLIVGASGTDVSGGDSGSAYVFTRSGTVWNLEQKLIAADAMPSDHFGGAVSISGDTLIVGARGVDEGGFDFGSAYVFTRRRGAWSQQQRLIASVQSNTNFFGTSVSVSGDTIVVGASGNGTRIRRALADLSCQKTC